MDPATASQQTPGVAPAVTLSRALMPCKKQGAVTSAWKTHATQLNVVIEQQDLLLSLSFTQDYGVVCCVTQYGLGLLQMPPASFQGRGGSAARARVCAGQDSVPKSPC